MIKFLKRKKILFLFVLFSVFTIGFSSWNLVSTNGNIKSNVNIESGNIDDGTSGARIENLKCDSQLFFDVNDDGSNKDELYIFATGRISNLLEFKNLIIDFEIIGNDANGNLFSDNYKELLNLGYLSPISFNDLTPSSEILHLESGFDALDLDNEGTYWYYLTNQALNNDYRDFMILKKVSYGRFFNYMNPIDFFDSDVSNGIKKGSEYTLREKHNILSMFSTITSTTSNKCEYQLSLISESYDINRYDVFFDFNGGQSDEINQYYGSFIEGNDFLIPNVSPQKSGFEFKGWSLNGDGVLYQPGETINITKETFGSKKNVTFLANFGPYDNTLQKYTFKFYESNNSTNFFTYTYSENQSISINGDIFGARFDNKYFAGWECNNNYYEVGALVSEIVDENQNVYNMIAVRRNSNITVKISAKENDGISVDYSFSESFVFPTIDELISKNSAFDEFQGLAITGYDMVFYNYEYKVGSNIDTSTFYNYDRTLDTLYFTVEFTDNSAFLLFEFNGSTSKLSVAKDSEFVFPSASNLPNLGIEENRYNKYEYIERYSGQKYTAGQSVVISTEQFPQLDVDGGVYFNLNHIVLRDITVNWINDDKNSLLSSFDSTKTYLLNEEVELDTNKYSFENGYVPDKWEISVVENKKIITIASDSSSFILSNDNIGVDGTTVNIKLLAKDGGCFTYDSLLIGDDFVEKEAKNFSLGDKVLTFNHESGEFEFSPIVILNKSDLKEFNILELIFSNGKTIKIITEHLLLNSTTRQYEKINYDNVSEKIGNFYLFDEIKDGSHYLSICKLIGFNIYKEKTVFYGIATAYNFNHLLNNAFSLTDGIDGLYNYFELNNYYVYDPIKKARDISKFGLYDYEDWDLYLSELEFNIFNVKYLKVSVGKKLLTEQKIIFYINKFLR